ncbi:hypothetical protein AXX17_AT3G34770 [Arabidopsis thaliana]|uniref:Retrotransposon gag domain-containing protein n=1 Tax=Arabidopsis thaliana TaxID=3702 RepID=A0A178VEX7_ARATH|nr:hypothetical protein AXX17_AT3G34770 [Arabidopsis thaliana]
MTNHSRQEGTIPVIQGENQGNSHENTVEHLLGVLPLEEPFGPLAPVLKIINQSRNKGRIPIIQSHHKVIKKRTLRRHHVIPLGTENVKGTRKRRGKQTRTFLLDSRLRSKQLLGRKILTPLVNDSHGEEEQVEDRVSRPSDENLRRCLSNFESYYGENNIPEHERLQIVYSNLDGETGSVREYRERFEAICLGLVTLPGQHLEEIFIQGLKPTLQDAVRRFKSNGIVGMMNLAQWLEEASENDNGTGGDTRAPVSGYRAGIEELMCMTMVQGNQEVFSTCGLMKNKELKFFGSISGHHVSVRIDSGATNNFMPKDLAIHFKLPGKETNLVSVLLGHGLHIKSKEKCMGIGGTSINWEKNIMSFNHGNKWVTIGEENDVLHPYTKENLKLSTIRVKMRSGNEQEEFNQGDAGEIKQSGREARGVAIEAGIHRGSGSISTATRIVGW